MIRIVLILLITFSSFAREYYVGYNIQSKSKLENLHVLKDHPNLELALVETDKEDYLETFDFYVVAPRTFTLRQKNLSTPKDSTNSIWGKKRINTTEANRLSNGEGVNVLVLDSGIDKDHPFIKNKIKKIADFTNSADSLALAYPGFDITGHGTHVAGKILADRIGIAPNANLIVGKVCIFLCRDNRAMIDAFEWALGEDIDIINMSFSSKNFPYKIGKRIAKKLEEKNIIAIAAAGNTAKEDNQILFPAKFTSVLSVGSIDKENNRSDFSNFSEILDIVAPGEDILSLSLTKGLNSSKSLLRTMSGTSMATPHVSGVAALIKSINHNFSATKVREIIRKSAKVPAGKDNSLNEYGHGLINAKRAVEIALSE